MALSLVSLVSLVIIWLSPALISGEKIVLTLAISGSLLVSLSVNPYKESRMYHRKSVSNLAILSVMALAIAILGLLSPIMAYMALLAKEIIESLSLLVSWSPALSLLVSLVSWSPALSLTIPLKDIKLISLSGQYKSFETIKERIDTIGVSNIFSVTYRAGDITESGKYRIMQVIEKWLYNSLTEIMNNVEPYSRYITTSLDSYSDNMKRDTARLYFYNALSDISLENLENAISFDWIISKGRISGSFPKRLAKWIKATHNIKLDSNILGKIGSIYQENINNNAETVYIDYANKINWFKGDYGDYGSCYWGCHREAKDILNDCDSFVAFRFYKNETRSLYNDTSGDYENIDCLLGEARVWSIIDTPHNNMLMIFNAYSKESEYGDNKHSLIYYARVISTLYGLSYKKISLWNNGECGGKLWINHKDESIGGDCYLIGEWSQIENIDSYDLNLFTGNYTKCYMCGESIDLDNDNYVEYENDYYCENCAYDNLFYCESHSDYESINNRVEVNTYHRLYNGSLHSHIEYMCNNCANQTAFYCEDCSEYYDNEYYSSYEVSGSLYCAECLDSQGLTECHNCGDIVDSAEVDENSYCVDCRENE